MSVRYYILAGGSGHRLKSLHVPKALAPIPNYTAKAMETILDRTLRLLNEDVALCIGFYPEMFDKYQYEKIITYDPKHPVGVAYAMLQCVELAEHIDRHVFLFGDVVYTKYSIKLIKDHMNDGEIVFFPGNPTLLPIHCVSILKSFIPVYKQTLESKLLPNESEKKWRRVNKKGRPENAPVHPCMARANTLLHNLSKKTIVQIADWTDDIDTDQEYFKMFVKLGGV